jgi:hypothetical protein
MDTEQNDKMVPILELQEQPSTKYVA